MPRLLHLSTALLLATACAAEGESSPEPRQADAPSTHAEQVFQKYDADKSGAITPDEAEGMLAHHFTAIDLDANGAIDLDEMTEAASKAHDAHHAEGDDSPVDYKAAAAEAHVNEVMATYDADNDGALSHAEVADQPFAEHFDVLDGDNDGAITSAELLAHIQAAPDHP